MTTDIKRSKDCDSENFGIEPSAADVKIDIELTNANKENDVNHELRQTFRLGKNSQTSQIPGEGS